ncbi:LOW QUALITY PROTEIN: hypothetical protein N5P37_011785 [Trichoderma harzianum]|nr:LOW QUALITY PROTEIN: hypothetical protein N5P37_011785 [Trichoderma harzianum]
MSITFTVFKGSPAKKITESQTTIPALLNSDKNTYSGVCDTDAHYLYADMVLGYKGYYLEGYSWYCVKGICGFGFSDFN